MNIAFYRFIQGCLFVFFKIWNRYTIHGAEHIPAAGQGFVLASNHVSHLDPPVLGSRIVRPITFLAKEGLFTVPLLGSVIKWLGAVPIAAASDFRVLRSIIRHIKQGEVVVIFPGGTRSSGEDVHEGQAGVAFLAHATGAPVLPCYIDGSDRALARGKRWIRPGRISVYLGKPLYVPKERSQLKSFYQDQASRIMKAIADLKKGVSSQYQRSSTNNAGTRNGH